MSNFDQQREYLPSPDEILENYDDGFPKFFFADTLNDFCSINYLGLFQCEFPEGCDHRTINPPYCPEHMKFCCSVEVRESELIPGQKGLFAAVSEISPVVPNHPTTAFFPGHQICLYGRKKGSEINPNSGNITYRTELEEIYGQHALNIYSFATDQNNIYDCALIRYPGAYANDAEADNGISGRVNNAIINYNDQECWLEATRKIDYGEEIFVDYGPDYWTKQNCGHRYSEGTQIPRWFQDFYKEAYFIDLLEQINIG